VGFIKSDEVLITSFINLFASEVKSLNLSN